MPLASPSCIPSYPHHSLPRSSTSGLLDWKLDWTSSSLSRHHCRLFVNPEALLLSSELPLLLPAVLCQRALPTHHISRVDQTSGTATRTRKDRKKSEDYHRSFNTKRLSTTPPFHTPRTTTLQSPQERFARGRTQTRMRHAHAQTQTSSSLLRAVDVCAHFAGPFSANNPLQNASH